MKVTWRFSLASSRAIKHVHYSGGAICFAVAVLFEFLNTGLAGLWTTRIILLVTVATGVVFKFIGQSQALNKFENLYFSLFAFLPAMIAGILLVPFLGIAMVISLFGQLVEPAKNIYFEDDKLRVQSTFVGVLGPARIDIYEKKWPFEKRLKRADFSESEIDSIQVSYDTDSTRVTAYGLYDDDRENKKSEILSFERVK
jgi:hypothetical protein